MTSVIGETSNFAATLGRTALPKAVAPATICVKLNCFCVAKINAVMFSAVNPLNASLSATSTLFKFFVLQIIWTTYRNTHCF